MSWGRTVHLTTLKNDEMPKIRGERAKLIKSDITGAFEDGKVDIEALRDKITEWKENLEGNNMEHLPKYDEVSKCADQLETACDRLVDCEVPDFIEIVIAFAQDTCQSAGSRSGRMSNALSALYAAKDAAEAWLGENEELEVTDLDDLDDEERLEAQEADDYVSQEMADERAEQREKAEEFVNILEEAIIEAEGASFPGMFS